MDGKADRQTFEIKHEMKNEKTEKKERRIRKKKRKEKRKKRKQDWQRMERKTEMTKYQDMMMNPEVYDGSDQKRDTAMDLS